MSPEEKLSLLLLQQHAQFRYLDRRLHMIEARIAALASQVHEHLQINDQTPFSAAEFSARTEKIVERWLAKLSEFPPPEGELPDHLPPAP